MGSPFKAKDTHESTSEIERFHGTLKDRTKVLRAFRDIETLIQFSDGWLTYYNYFKPHQSLNGETPAQAANIKYDVKNWADLAKIPVSKETERQSHLAPNIKVVREKVDLEKALKRRRGRNPWGSGHNPPNWRELRRATPKGEFHTPQAPRITPRFPKITKQHYSKRGGGLTRRGDI